VAQMSCGTYVGGTNVSGTNVGGTKLASPKLCLEVNPEKLINVITDNTIIWLMCSNCSRLTISQINNLNFVGIVSLLVLFT
jgi:hypothetical protein